MKQSIRFLALAIAVFFTAFTANAQVTTSSVGGKVTDAQGAVVGAAIIATHTPSGTQYYTVSGSDGQYRINNIVPGGPYTIQVEMLGYQKIAISEVYAPLAETIFVDASLKEEVIGLDAATVVADASTSGMNIRRSGASTTISERTKDNMPSVSRSMNDIMALTPQASSTTSGFAVGGGNYRGSTVTVDGAAFNNAFGIGQNLPAGGAPISLDALEQISVNVTPFDVRQSGFLGGAINAVTKSGSNEWHASAYDYYTSGGLRGYKAEGNTVNYSPNFNNTLGFTIGGPIVKNKLFFFVNFEYVWDKTSGASQIARATDSDQWGGSTGISRASEVQLATIKNFLSERYGYDPGLYQGYSVDTPIYKLMARVDWNISKNNKFNIRFSKTHNPYSSSPSSSMSPLGSTDSKFKASDGVSYFWNRYNEGRQSIYAMPFESSRYIQGQDFTSLAAELNTRFMDGKANNVARVAWSHQDEARSYAGGYFPTVDIMEKDLSSNNVNPDSVPVSTPDNKPIANYTTFGSDPFTYGNLRDVQTIIVTDEVSFNVGKHNLLAGLQYEWNRAKNGYMQGGAGWYIYDSWDAFVADATNPTEDTYPMAFMMTFANNSNNPAGQVYPAFDYKQFSAYLQDEINFSDNFKMTAGIRFEVPSITIPSDNENTAFAERALTPRWKTGEKAQVVPGKNEDYYNSTIYGLSTASIPTNRLTVSPRIGFNWDMGGNRKFILRGGTGMYTGRIPFVWLVSAIGNDNCMQYQFNTGQKIHFTNDRAEMINRISDITSWQTTSQLPKKGTIIDSHLRMPSNWKSSLAFDFTLPGGVKGTVEGVYSYNFNEVYAMPLGYTDEYTSFSQDPETEKWSSKKEKTIVQIPGEPQTRKAFVKDNSGTEEYYITNVSNLHGYYYSITAQLSKSFRNGIDLMAAYTNSGAKSVSDGSGDQVTEFANTYSVNGSNSPELGYANYVAPNRFIASFNWKIDEGKYTATKLSAFYDGYNQGYISNYSYARVSYVMNNVGQITQNEAGEYNIAKNGTGAYQLLYIPLESELESMNFINEDNKRAFNNFIHNDDYCSKHRGEYMERNGVKAPWVHRFNVRVAQDFYFNVAGRKQTLEVGLDIKNLGNLLCEDWGTFKQLSNNNVLSLNTSKDKKSLVYTFTKPQWQTYNNVASTWQMLLSFKWFF